MNYSPIQLESIRIFGKKDLTDWCHTLEKNWTMWHCWNWEWKKFYNSKWEWWISSDYWEHMWEILWHEPHLFPDVARVVEERWWLLEIKWGLLTITFPDRTYTSCKYLTTLPLLEQSEETLTKLINLFK